MYREEHGNKTALLTQHNIDQTFESFFEMSTRNWIQQIQTCVVQSESSRDNQTARFPFTPCAYK